MADNTVQIVINTDGSQTIAATNQVLNQFALLNSELKTGIQETAYGINAGTVSITNSYVNMSQVAHQQVSQLTNETIKDAVSMNERIRKWHEDNKRLEQEIDGSVDELKAKYGLGTKEISEDSQAASASISEVNTISLAAAIKYGIFGAAAVGAAELVVAAYKNMTEGAKLYREETEKTALRSRVTGIDTGAMQDIEFVGKMSGVNFDTLLKGYKNIEDVLAGTAKESNKAKEALDAMHISLADGSGQAKTTAAVILEMADQFKSYEDGANKAALANAVFESSEGILISFLDRGGKVVQEYLSLAEQSAARQSALEVQKQENAQASARIQEAAAAEASKDINKSYNEMVDAITRDADSWTSISQDMSNAFALFGADISRWVDIIKIKLGMLPEAFKNAQKSVTAGSTLGESESDSALGTVTNPYTASSGSKKSSAPSILSVSDFEKTLTQRRNVEANLFVWEAENSAQYWRQVYNWAVGEYGKESALAQQLWNKYADAARVAHKTASSSASGADPFGIEQLREKIHQIKAEFSTMYREFHNSQYSFWEQEAQSQGKFEEAATLKNWATYENSLANIAQQTEKAKVDIQMLEDKLHAARGVDPEATKEIEREISRRSELIGLDNQRAEIEKKRYDLAQDQLDRKQATELAGVNASYAELTGTMEQQLKTQLALIEANAQEKLGIEWRTANLGALGEAYRNVYLEQERLKKIDLGEYGDWEAFKQGIKDATSSYDTHAMSVRKSAKSLVSELNTGFSSFFQQIWKGELKSAEDYFTAFCKVITDAFSKALSNMMSDLITSGLTDALKGSGSGGGIFDFLGSLFGFGGGGSASSSSVWQGAGLNDYVFMPGLWHGGGRVGLDSPQSYRLMNPFAFINAPRLHSGLAADEFPAILQAGEEVRSRAQVQADRAAQRQMNVEIKIDNQSSAPLKLEQNSVTHSFDKIIIGVVAKDINEYGVLGQMLRNRK